MDCTFPPHRETTGIIFKGELNMPFKLGPLELVLILVIVFIIFGAGKLPQIFGSMGKAIRSFREGSSGADEAEEEEVKPRRKKTSSTKTKKTKKASSEEEE
jgi:sec-independent protein translocase protein TatA